MRGEGRQRVAVPWLPIATSIGRVATALLIASNFVYLFAPLAYTVNALTGAGRSLDFTDPSAALVLLLGDSHLVLSVGDLLVAVGAMLLAGAFLCFLIALRAPDRTVSRVALLLGVAALASLVAWAIAAAVAFGRPPGGGIGAAANRGDRSLAAALLLVASLLYVGFEVRMRKRSRRGPLAPYPWLAFAGVNLVGSAAVASFFLGGSRDAEVLFIGLALEIVLVPLLGVVAYKRVWDDVGDWSGLGLREAPPPVGELVGEFVGEPVEEWPAEEPPPAEEPIEELPPPPPD